VWGSWWPRGPEPRPGELDLDYGNRAPWADEEHGLTLPDPMLIDLLMLLSGLLVGCLLTTWVNAARLKRDLARVTAHMTAQVRERIEAYIELEAQVRNVVLGMEQSETSFVDEDQKRRWEVLELSHAPAEHDGEQPPVTGQDGEAEPESAAGGEQGEIQRWQQRLKDVQAEKQAQLERQNELIQQLAVRIRTLEARRREDGAAGRKSWLAKQELVERVGRDPEPAPSDVERVSEAEADRERALEEAESASRQLRAQSEHLRQRNDLITELTEELDDLRNNYKQTRKSVDGQKVQIYDLMRELDHARRRPLPREAPEA